MRVSAARRRLNILEFVTPNNRISNVGNRILRPPNVKNFSLRRATTPSPPPPPKRPIFCIKKPIFSRNPNTHHPPLPHPQPQKIEVCFRLFWKILPYVRDADSIQKYSETGQAVDLFPLPRCFVGCGWQVTDFSELSLIAKKNLHNEMGA